MRVFVAISGNWTTINGAHLEDEHGNEIDVSAEELTVEYDGSLVLIGPIDLAETAEGEEAPTE